MLDIKLSDFKVGEKCYVEFIGNASRYRGKGYYEEWIVEKIGRKYVTVTDKIKRSFLFELHSCSYNGLVEKSEYSPNYILYPSEQMLLDKFEAQDIYDKIKVKFARCVNKDLTLEQLREINKILDN